MILSKMALLRRLSVVLLGAVSAASLAACGSDSSSKPTGKGVTADTVIPSTASTPTSPATSAPATVTSPAPTSSTMASSAAPAPAGAAITAGAVKKLAATVGAFDKQPASGPATIYENSNGNQIGVSFLSGSKYETIVTALTKSKTRAGTGTCGTDDDPTNATCYLKAADGVYNVSGDDVPTLAAFSNQLASALGTS